MKPHPSFRKEGQDPPPRRPALPTVIIDRCRSMRQDATDAESLLWLFLRNRQLLGYKFRRQYPIGQYIADFYCHEKRLIIELDGGGHIEENQEHHDQVRTQKLEAQGMRVIRFWNDEVLKETQTVLEEIAFTLTSTA